MHRFHVLTVALAIAASACGSCRRDAGAGATTSDAADAVEPPVPAPPGLLAEASLRDPDDAWARMQRGVGGALALFPSTTGQLACTLAGLDPDIAPLVNGRATSFVALGERAAGSDLAWAIALPLTDGARAASQLLAGDASRYTSRTEGNLRVLSRIGGPLPAAVALVPGGRWLLVARDEAALLALGPYAYRTMPTKPAPSSGAFAVAVAPRSALGGPIAEALLSQWLAAKGWLVARDEEERSRHGGRAPDFGDPRAILDAADAAIRARVTLLAEARDARLELEVAEDRVRADLAVAPGDGEAGAGGLDSMRPGDALPLARAPSDSVLAVLLRDDAAARAAGARDLAAVLARVMGERLKPDDERALRAALDDWARGRGDWVTAAIPWGETRGLFVRTPAAEREVAVRAVRELVAMTQRASFGDPIARALSAGPASIAAADVPSFGRATVATFASKGGSVGGSAAPWGVAWGVREGDLFLAAGEGASRQLAAQSSPSATLGVDPVVAHALADLGSDAVLAVVAQPLRLDPTRAASRAAPAVVALGRRGGDLWARVEVSDALLRELIRLGASL